MSELLRYYKDELKLNVALDSQRAIATSSQQVSFP